jgi:pheromone shutdown protein TraB
MSGSETTETGTGERAPSAGDADDRVADATPRATTDDGEPGPVMALPPADDAGDEGSVRVVGTAHVSEESVAEVERVIDEERPDVVAVELDEGRFRQFQGGTPDDLEAGDLLRGNTVFQFLAYWMLSYVQARLGERFDVDPGAEMRAAVAAAPGVGAGVALVDRDIQVTIQRFWARMSLVEKLRVVSALAFGAVSPAAVAATTTVVTGVLLGPVLAVGTFLGGVTSATMAQFATGGLAGLLAGYLTSGRGGQAASAADAESADGGSATTTALPLAVAAAVGVAVAATGVGSATLDGALSGVFVYVLGGVTLAGGVGLVVGALLARSASGTAEVDPDGEPLAAEDLTDADVITAMMEEFREFSPGGAAALIDERDAYIAHNLVWLREQGYDVVAVVGAGHRAGVEGYLDRPETLPAFETLVGREAGRRVSVYRVFGYLFTLGFLAFFGLLVLGGAGNDLLIRLFVAWFLFNGAFAFTTAKLAGARWTSAAVGGAVAWFTSINPLLAPGWFAGYVELRYVTVNVADIGRLNEIVADESRSTGELLRDLLEVPLFRLIAVVGMTNLGSFAASLLFPFVVLPFVAEGGGVALIGELVVEGVRNGLDVVSGVVS